ncbi:MAG: B-box zinc finger protein [Bryobacteraceae bacterium]|jgi:hypothetical protein
MPLPKEGPATGDAAVCTRCGAANRVRLFPAAFARPAGARPEAAAEGEAACFDHPGKRAVAACQQCGRFVCQLCAVGFGGETWCPSCVAAGSGRARAASPATSLTLFDSIVLTIPFAALVFWPLTALTAPCTITLAAMTWKKPLSPVRRWRWRFLAGIGVSLLQLGLWVWAIGYLVARIATGR